MPNASTNSTATKPIALPMAMQHKGSLAEREDDFSTLANLFSAAQALHGPIAAEVYHHRKQARCNRLPGERDACAVDQGTRLHAFCCSEVTKHLLRALLRKLRCARV